MTVTRQVRTSRWGAPVVTAVSSTTRRWHRTHRTHHTRRTHPSRRYRRQRINPSNLARPLPPSDRWVFPISLTLRRKIHPQNLALSNPVCTTFSFPLVSSPLLMLLPLSGVLTRPSLPEIWYTIRNYETVEFLLLFFFFFFWKTRFRWIGKCELCGQSVESFLSFLFYLTSSRNFCCPKFGTFESTKQLNFSLSFFEKLAWVFVESGNVNFVDKVSNLFSLSLLSDVFAKFLLPKFGILETTKQLNFHIFESFILCYWQKSWRNIE